jgi:predicted permease
LDIFWLILLNIIIPIFFLIFIGALLHRIFSFDLNTLSKLNTYFLLPAVCFVNIYKGEVTTKLILLVVLFLVVLNLLLIFLSSFLAKLNGYDSKLAASFRNSFVLSNSGNFGLPVGELVFHMNPLGVAIQVIVSIFQNLLTFTYGLYNAVAIESKGYKLAKEILKLPVLYALVLALMLRSMDIQIHQSIWTPIENVSNAFLAIALLTLGAQVAYLQLKKPSNPLILSVIGRLIVSPIVAFLIILLFGIEGTTAQALFIASSYPTSRNSALLALEYNNYPDYAVQVVMLTTVLSSITVAFTVYLSTLLF